MSNNIIERPSWNQTFLEMLYVIAKRSTCLKTQTSAIITKDNRVISIGYNGTVSDTEHCYEYWTKKYKTNNLEEIKRDPKFIDEHKSWSLNNEVHGEQNAILFAAKEGIKLDGTTLYSLYSPCLKCAHCIFQSGIKKVYYLHQYRDNEGVEFLKSKNICVNLIV